MVLLHAKLRVQGAAIQWRDVEGKRSLRRFGTTSFLRAAKPSKPPIKSPQKKKTLDYRYAIYLLISQYPEAKLNPELRLASPKLPLLQNQNSTLSVTAQSP
jgi:methyltransferase OMS1